MQYKGKVSIASVLVALGIIYGDIGTSPLYALKAVVGTRKIEESLVYGGVSAIFWTLLIQTTFKYIWLTLKADNQGEGGIFSLYALVKRYGKSLSYIAILGATTLLADGIITPPISVASAVEGLAMVNGLSNIFVAGSGTTVLLVCIILSLLFFFQRFGTQSIGTFFGPLMLLWFTMLLLLGIAQISSHPAILKALNPVYAYQLLAHYPKGFWLLGAVFLCTTGAEALYSDLGHCGIRNIRVSWIFVKFSLMSAYLGQAAWLITQQGMYLNGRNPFFEIVPAWFLIPSILIATVATIIASQALISGSYTLISEAMNLNFWPRVGVRQPSDIKGQIYIPSVNTILWAGCILMIVYFKSSEHMEAAYGFSITITMMMTTILLSFYLRYIRKWKTIAVLMLLAVFALVETSFFVANVAKIKERWMFLFFELGIFMVMYVWHHARKINNKLTKFVDLGKYSHLFKALVNDEQIQKRASHLIYLTKANSRHEIEEKIIKSIFAKKPKRADMYWFFHLHRTNQPYDLNYEVSELIEGCLIKVNIHIGFRIQPKSELYFKKILSELSLEKMNKLNAMNQSTLKYSAEPDFSFVIIEKFLSVENEFQLKDGMLLSTYFFLKRLGQSDEAAFGLDRNDVLVEYVPLIYQPISNIQLQRIL